MRHWITSSARSSRRLRDREAERLRGVHVDDELELDGCWTGRSPGLAPFRILST